jgi:cytochrome P450
MPILGFGNVVAVADPQLAKQVLNEKPDVLLGGEGVGPAAVIYGPRSMFVQEEPQHLERRRLLIPPLHGDALVGYVPVIESATLEAMSSWPIGRPMRMLEAARELTRDVIIRVVFGVDDPDDVRRFGEPFDELLTLALSEETPVRYAMRRLGAVRMWGRLAAVNKRIDELVLPLISQLRSARSKSSRSVLALLAEAHYDNGEALSDRTIRDDLVTLVLAGHETTATTLAWMVDLLLHHDAELDRVREEANSGETTYTEAVINETLRLRPPAPITGRMTTGPYRLGDYTIPAQTRIVILLDLINRNATNYPDPDEFRPERFFGTRPPSHSWIPFGGGVKRCIGASFSLCELTTVLHTILRCAELVPARTQLEKPPYRAAPVQIPSHGTQVIVNRSCRQKAN